MYRILIVEDDAVIARQIQQHLSRWDLDASIVEDFSDVLGLFQNLQPHLVLMDISLPFFNGYYWCDQIRRHSTVPILFLSSRADNMDIIMAVQMGGDDYIAKPLSLEVLTAKIQAMLRRTYHYEMQPALTLRDAVLDLPSLCLVQGEEKTPLTRNEARLLQSLLSKKGSIVTREELMLALWDSDMFVDDNTLTVNVNRLRKTLEQAGISHCIVTHKREGYAIDD